MNKIKVSVIVPVYNTEKYLRECLDSLVNQTLKDIQIVIVDDGSTDSSPEIIAEYKNNYSEKITAIRQKNAGQGKARNVAFQYCVGEYIGFLDSDDYAKLDMFEKMYNKAKKTDADVIACGYSSFCVEKGKVKILKAYYASQKRENPLEMYLGMYASSCLHLIRKEIIIQKDIRYTEGVIYEDTAFFAKLIPYINTIDFIEESLVLRRMRANSTLTSISFERTMEMLTVMNDINDFFKIRDLVELMDLKECFCVRVLLCSHLERICMIQKRCERKLAVLKIIDYINKNYPQYKSNPYFSGGVKNLYIKNSSILIVNILCEIMRLKKKVGIQYT